MNWDIAKGNWKVFKSKVREKWSELTDDDLEYAHSKRDYLEGRLQRKYGYRKEDAKKQIDKMLAKISA